ncbi:MAG: CoA ester lyase [Bacteroidales bacterium]
MLINSFHFIPLSKPEYFTKIEKIPAGYFILDLEDSVSDSEKDLARENLKKYFSTNKSSRFFLRINSEIQFNFYKDIQLVNDLKWSKLLIPKISNKLLDEIIEKLNFKPNLFLLFETVQSINQFDEILKNIDSVDFVGIGFEDILSDYTTQKTEIQNFIQNISNQFIFKAKAHQIPCIDGISTSKDSSVFEQECEYSKSLGFDGKMSISPFQVEIINNTWRISDKEYDTAKQLIEKGKCKKETGYIIVENELISPAKIKKANKIIESYEKI